MTTTPTYLRQRAGSFSALADAYEAHALNRSNSDAERDAYNEVVLRLSDCVDALTAAAERLEERDGMRLPLHIARPVLVRMP